MIRTIALLLFLTTSLMYGNAKIIVTGKILQKEPNAPLEYAIVSFTETDHVLLPKIRVIYHRKYNYQKNSNELEKYVFKTDIVRLSNVSGLLRKMYIKIIP
ncbi:hypothetical protein [Flavivirga sp. 57AJ16]|uniref:hypothetical protein n=1 Tax=Flavivirga sp. 57AJ16 TaxID=3025307 RepID=UPI00236576DD|nr:hypothetical protein [Flavivirga sp. 57AJ16]MDD7886744.1 hypothetical protein [Flavivirga sp. 57AJ16]